MSGSSIFSSEYGSNSSILAVFVHFLLFLGIFLEFSIKNLLKDSFFCKFNKTKKSSILTLCEEIESLEGSLVP